MRRGRLQPKHMCHIDQCLLEMFLIHVLPQIYDGKVFYRRGLVAEKLPLLCVRGTMQTRAASGRL